MADLQTMQVFLIFAFLTGCCSASCPTNWNQRACYCYRLFSSTKDFSDAEQECQKNGAHLASVLTSAEQTYIYKLWQSCNPISKRLWIGLEDPTGSNDFSWIDGSCLDYSNWRTGEPSSSSERCAHMWQLPEHSFNGDWNDTPCTGYKASFVCKKIAK